MGQSINPASLRLGSNPKYRKLWMKSKWGSKNLLDYANKVREDHVIEDSINKFVHILSSYYRVYISRSVDSSIIVDIKCLSVHLDKFKSMKSKLDHMLSKICDRIKLSISLLPTYLAIGYGMQYAICEALLANPKTNLGTLLTKTANSVARKNPSIQGIHLLCNGRIRGANIANKEEYSTGSVKRSTIKSNVFQLITPLQLPSGILSVRSTYQLGHIKLNAAPVKPKYQRNRRTV